jgi:hypothetical protein
VKEVAESPLAMLHGRRIRLSFEANGSQIHDEKDVVTELIGDIDGGVLPLTV